MTRSWLLPMTLLLAASAAGAQMTPAPSKGVLPYDQPDRVSNGARIYADYCASCHGVALEGQPDWRVPDADGYLPAPPHDPSGHTWHHDDLLLLRIVTLGTEAIVGGNYRSNMSGFGDVLEPDEILDVLGFIKSTWPDEVIEIHNEINGRSGAFGN
ncbi:cytochrome c [Thalassococcus sp. CAU 1522]|uniref:Cytochrome c n=1 Tax=Thalassococcus arenae TaxID=2851652 RepID=A0ABS6N5M9_9RHOB|nr:cytochrome c [Thalassococcus arenae]MBV2358914.1 cytochrome c [Thalassococcus arenae]